jgi:hypothetical protein
MEVQEPVVKFMSREEMKVSLALLLVNGLIYVHQTFSWETMPQEVFNAELIVEGMISLYAFANSLTRFVGDVLIITDEQLPPTEIIHEYKTAIGNALVRFSPVLPTIAQLIVHSLSQPLPPVDPQLPEPPPLFDEGISV